MGILNVTPDSFSDGGCYLDPERALERALEMEAQGADLIDIGAESTRPGADPVPWEEEWRRLEPVLRRVVPRLSLPVSIDTQKAEVAKKAVDLGVSLINDVNALQGPGMLDAAAHAQVPVILMHKRGEPKNMQQGIYYEDTLREVVSFLEARIQAVCAAGLNRDKILIDPGIGFGKRFEDNLILLQNPQAFHLLECPLVVGASRKSFLKTMAGSTPEALLAGNLAAVAWAHQQKIGMVRVHDVLESVVLLKTLQGIRGF